MRPAPLVLVEENPPVRIMTLNRPEVRNALNGALVDALLEALSGAEADPAVRAVVLTGAGSDFCAGADLKVLQEIGQRSLEENLEDSRHLASLFHRIHTYRLPVLAAVHGNALAGGAGLACVCDFVVAAKSSRLGFTEARIGFVAAIVSRFLIDRAGPRGARDLLLTARFVDAEEARGMGLVDRVVADDSARTEAVALARKLSRNAASSLALTKRLLSALPGRDLDGALEYACALNAETRAAADCREGVAAFLEKRKPRWIAES